MLPLIFFAQKFLPKFLAKLVNRLKIIFIYLWKAQEKFFKGGIFGMAFNTPYYQPTWNQQPRFPQYMQEQAVQIKGRPVSSIEEVKATTIDFDGSIFYFPDLANKKIYTKQINYDGTSTLNIYELKPIPVEPPAQPLPDLSNFVTKEELNEILQKFVIAQSSPQPTPVPQEPAKTEITKPRNLNF